MYGGGFLNNGITASVTNLLNAIDYSQYDVTLIHDGNNIKEEKWNNINKLNKNVRYLFRTGSWNATLTDLVRHAFVLKRGVYTNFMKKVAPASLYQREMERMTGLTEFDIAIDFSGYSPFWSSLIAFGEFKKKSIFLHADMGKEVHKKVMNRYPHRKNLKVIFSLYNFFDKVLSVSPLTHQENMKHLRHHIHNYQDKMDFVINTIDYNKILSSKDHYQYEFGKENDFRLLRHQVSYPLPEKANINFITIGRLGPEKDHEKLIKAFHKLTNNTPNARLYIVGEGVLKNFLRNLVKNLALTDKVIFTGQLSNPYALLNKCDCFVLSSNHEGQPMVLLEALVLGKPIIVTDIPGSRSVVEGGHGLIVENSIEGLIEGMTHFVDGKRLNVHNFDYENYQNNAIQMFYEKVCNLNDSI